MDRSTIQPNRMEFQLSVVNVRLVATKEGILICIGSGDLCFDQVLYSWDRLSEIREKVTNGKTDFKGGYSMYPS